MDAFNSILRVLAVVDFAMHLCGGYNEFVDWLIGWLVGWLVWVRNGMRCKITLSACQKYAARKFLHNMVDFRCTFSIPNSATSL